MTPSVGQSARTHLLSKTVCGQRQGAEKRDQVNFYLTRGRGNIYPTDNYIIEHVILANTLPQLK